MRIERLFDTGEGVGMVFQIDLHAADVNVFNAIGLQRFDERHGIDATGQKIPLAAGRNRPGPGKNFPVFSVPTPRFRMGNGIQQTCRNALAAFVLGDELRTSLGFFTNIFSRLRCSCQGVLGPDQGQAEDEAAQDGPRVTLKSVKGR